MRGEFARKNKQTIQRDALSHRVPHNTQFKIYKYKRRVTYSHILDLILSIFVCEGTYNK